MTTDLENGPRTMSMPYAQMRRGAIRPSDIVPFLLGLLSWMEIQFGGRLYVGELILLGYAVTLPSTWKRSLSDSDRRVLSWVFRFAGVYLFALIFTDVYRGTPIEDFSRGWSRAIFFVTDLIGLVVLSVGHQRRFCAWLLGAMLSQLIVVLVGSGGQVDMINWKLGVGEPITMIVIMTTGLRTPKWTYAALMLLGVVNLILDYRSMAAFAVATGVLTYLKLRRTRGRPLIDLPPLMLASTAVLIFVGAYVTNFSFLYSGQELVDRRGASNVGRAAALNVSAKAILASPLIGYGSWAKNFDLFSNWAYEQEDLGGLIPGDALINSIADKRDEVLPVHSQILQAGFEAGIGGMIFFVFLFCVCVARLWRVLMSREWDNEFAMFAFWAISTLWALLFSPFAGFTRLTGGIGIALLLAIPSWRDRRAVVRSIRTGDAAQFRVIRVTANEG
jgi:O-antigen ligase